MLSKCDVLFIMDRTKGDEKGIAFTVDLTKLVTLSHDEKVWEVKLPEIRSDQIRPDSFWYSKCCTIPTAPGYLTSIQHFCFVITRRWTMDCLMEATTADLCQPVAQSIPVLIPLDQMQIKVTQTFSWQLTATYNEWRCLTEASDIWSHKSQRPSDPRSDACVCLCWHQGGKCLHSLCSPLSHNSHNTLLVGINTQTMLSEYVSVGWNTSRCWERHRNHVFEWIKINWEMHSKLTFT